MKNRSRHPARSGDSGQTKEAGGDLFDKLHAYRDLHAHSLFSSLGRLVDTPFTSIFTIGVLAIAISLAASFYLLVINIQQFTGQIEFNNQISLFLKDNVSESGAKAFADEIKKNSKVKSVKLITKEQAFQEFQTYSGFGSAINALDTNPLPIVLEVTPKSDLIASTELDALLQILKKSPQVDLAQLDKKWLDRLHAIAELANNAMLLIAITLAAAVLFITGNTIRLELHNRFDEVAVAKLVGATNAFIKRPFLYSGFWIGLISGIIAWFMVTLMLLFIWQNVDALSQLYGGTFHLLFLSYSDSMALLSISVALSVLSSWMVLTYQLRRLKSE